MVLVCFYGWLSFDCDLRVVGQAHVVVYGWAWWCKVEAEGQGGEKLENVCGGVFVGGGDCDGGCSRVFGVG